MKLHRVMAIGLKSMFGAIVYTNVVYIVVYAHSKYK